jgi:hypothetical protein
MWGTGRQGVWSETDLLLEEAFDEYERGLCSCGQPLTHTADVANTMEFPIKELTCGSCQVLESKNKNSEPAPGVKRYVENNMSRAWR